MTEDVWLVETYFDWLWTDCFTNPHERKEYEGALRVLHEIPFYWTLWSDENRAGDALSFRQSDFLSFQPDLDHLDQFWLGAWATAAPSVLEVLLGIARRWHLYFEGEIAYYFQLLFRNLELDRYPGRVLTTAAATALRIRVDEWMSRQFNPDGTGSPFPCRHVACDLRRVDIWGQMNAYSAEHFQ